MLFAMGDQLVAAASDSVDTYIGSTFTYEKGSNSLVIYDSAAKDALSDTTDLLALAAGRYTAQTAVTSAEFSNYLGYVNYNLTAKNGVLPSAADYLSAALAVGAAGGTPTATGTDSGGNKVNLLYKGIYSRSLTTLTKEGTSTVAYALITLDALHVSDATIHASGSKVTRAQLKTSLIASATTLAAASTSDLTTCGLVMQSLAPYYRAHQTPVVTAVNSLLDKIDGLQAANGSFGDSVIATAEIMTGVTALDINPAVTNDYFKYSIYDGLLTFYHSDGGFGLTAAASSTAAATNYGRIALVSYWCYQQNAIFYDFSGVTAHTATKIATSSTSSTSSSSSSASSSSSGTSSNSATSSSSSSDTTTTTSASGTTIAKSVFEGIQGQDTTYVYEGTWNESEPYTISFNGKDITTPMDFNAEITSVAENQTVIDAAASDPEYITFLHDGDFPGNATVTVTVSVTDGNYKCYYYNADVSSFEFVGDVTVSSSMVSFEANKGGDYFLTTDEINTDDGIAMDLADTVDGVVQKSVFESIEGNDVNLRLTGTTDQGTAYTIVFNGADITEPMDFDMRINETSDNADAIGQLADAPWILHFAQEGSLPGTAQVEIDTALDETTPYMLFYYNEDQMQAEYMQKVTIKDGQAKFTIDHCCDYFIAESATSDSLLGTVSNGSNRGFLVLAYVFVAFLLAAAGVGVLLRFLKETSEGTMSGPKKRKPSARKLIAARKKAKLKVAASAVAVEPLAVTAPEMTETVVAPEGNVATVAADGDEPVKVE